MLRTIRHHLVFLLFVLLPFHALFVTVGTKLIEGPGHAPLSSLAIWKEGLMALIFLVSVIELFLSGRENIAITVRGKRFMQRISWESGLILALLTIALILAISYQLSAISFIYGFKYLFVPLIFFAVLASFPWEENFLGKKLFPALLIVGGIVSLYGIITFFLPQSFFTFLGYSDAHSLYAAGSPLSAFQQISGTGIRRIQSTFSGPNQFGLWLLVPWSVGLCVMLSGGPAGRASSSLASLVPLSMTQPDRRRSIPYLFLIATALLLTFSRSAWIAAFIVTLIAIGMTLSGKQRNRILAGLISTTVLTIVILWMAAPALINRSISNRHHFERVREGISTVIKHPLGLGLGSAGPASNRTSDACIYFDEGSDISWAKDRSDLCLFVGDVQTQPSPDQKVCHCPLLPENWYVQVGIELGIAGFILFLLLVIFLAPKLMTQDLAVFLMFVGVSIAALFLHAWEDSAVAYTVWGLVGIVVLFSSSEEPRFGGAQRWLRGDESRSLP